jgi:1-acyl-sn-glycerol-3-phosphate acyltransferase
VPAYVLLTRLTPDGMKKVLQTPDELRGVRRTLEEYEATVLADYHVLGKFNHCIIFEVSDNFRAMKAALQLELTHQPESMLLPGIDIDLFERMVKQEIRTEGPHEWQVEWWAKIARASMRWYQYSRWMWKYCKPFTATGKQHFKGIDGPCIVVGNHTSHFDALALFHGLPQKIKWNIYFGAAADRWFLKDGGGRKELALQPWYNSLVVGSFPIKRGGGSATLEYSQWLLKQGGNLAIFPEGTRSTSRKLSRFKHGVAILALKQNVPIVPCYLTGLNKLRPKGTNKIFPGPASANYQKPIYLPKDISIPDATRMIYDAVNEVHQRVIKHGPQVANSEWREKRP